MWLFIWQRFGVEDRYIKALFELLINPFSDYYDNMRKSLPWFLWQQIAAPTLQMWWMFGLGLVGCYPPGLLSSSSWRLNSFLPLLDHILHFFSSWQHYIDILFHLIGFLHFSKPLVTTLKLHANENVFLWVLHVSCSYSLSSLT